MRFEVGDIVKWKASFLQSCGWYTDVPKDGKVIGINSFGFPIVAWCDREEYLAVPVNPANLLKVGQPDYSGM